MMTMECVSSAVSAPGDNIQLLHTAQSAEKGKQADTIHILQLPFHFRAIITGYFYRYISTMPKYNFLYLKI